MSLDFPSLDEIVQRIQNDLQAQLPESNPFLDSSFIKAMVTSYAGRIEEMYLQMQILFNSLFLNTASGEFVDEWGNIYQIQRLPATSSTGTVNFQGTVGATIPINTLLQDNEGNQYQTDNEVVISLNSTTGVSGNVSGITVTITQTAHGFSQGMSIEVSGSLDSAINGTKEITAIIDNDSYTFDAPGTVTVGPIAGLTIQTDTISTTVTSVDTGSDTNVSGGPTVTLLSALSGVDSQAYVQLGGISGGADVETDAEYRQRIFDYLANPIAEFSESDIEQKISELKLSDETVVVSPWTTAAAANRPAPGQVFIVSVIVDKDTDAISNPTASEINLIAEQVDTIVPANIISPLIQNNSSGNVWITQPLALPTIDVIISSLDPSTDSMKEAIEENLKAYFVDSITVSQDNPEYSYTTSVRFNEINAVIQSTVDPQSGISPRLFSLTINGGTADIPVAQLERAVLGTVTFA